MNKYLVWSTVTKPENGRVIVESSSFAARQVCAKAWGIPVFETMARRIG